MGNNISVSKTININTNNVMQITKTNTKYLTHTMIANSSLAKTIPRTVCDDFNNKVNSYKILDSIKQVANGFTLPKSLTTNDKICFICCNSYENTRYILGEPAVNDGLLSYIHLEKLGYKVYLFHDLKRKQFSNIFKEFINANVKNVCVYYIGHGTTTHDSNGDETDGKDECLYFVDGLIIDDDLYDLINKCKNKSNQLILLTDCCHSGTIYDCPDRQDVLTISAAADNQTAKQDWIERRGQGIFTYYLWKYYSNNISIKDLESKMNNKLRQYQQMFVTNRIDKKDSVKGFI